MNTSSNRRDVKLYVSITEDPIFARNVWQQKTVCCLFKHYYTRLFIYSGNVSRLYYGTFTRHDEFRRCNILQQRLRILPFLGRNVPRKITHTGSCYAAVFQYDSKYRRVVLIFSCHIQLCSFC